MEDLRTITRLIILPIMLTFEENPFPPISHHLSRNLLVRGGFEHIETKSPVQDQLNVDRS
jgi:hypothetical protein